MSDNHMTLDDFYNQHLKLSSEEIILDVRGVDEYAQGHIANSVNIPLDQVMNKIDELKKYKKIYIHCKRGGRARTAFDALTHAGLNNLVCISDAGMDAWEQRGYPVKR